MNRLDELKQWKTMITDESETAIDSHHYCIHKLADLLDWAIAQLDRPADAEIDKAISYYTNLTERISQTLDNRNAKDLLIHGYEEQRTCYTLAIQALRQMRRDPCNLTASESTTAGCILQSEGD